MKLLAFDLGTHKTGWALGPPDCARPTVTVWQLRRQGQPVDDAVGQLACRIRDLLDIESDVGMIAVEEFLNPEAQPSADAVIASLQLHGCLKGIAKTYDIPVRAISVQEVRKHFIGRATAVPSRRRNDPPKSSRQQRIDREATKDLVWKQAVLLGYFDRGETPSWDRSDAVAVWDWAAATLCRAPRPFAFDPPRVSR